MSYLLDVNALIALGYARHVFHSRVAGWASKKGAFLLTCSISELGFVRVLCQLPEIDVSLSSAASLLKAMKCERGMRQLSDARSATDLPHWAVRPKQVTDAHLVELARSHSARLATLDKGIPGAFLIS